MSGSRRNPFCKFKSEKQRTWPSEPKFAHCRGAFLFRFDQLVIAWRIADFEPEARRASPK